MTKTQAFDAGDSGTFFDLIGVVHSGTVGSHEDKVRDLKIITTTVQQLGFQGLKDAAVSYGKPHVHAVAEATRRLSDIAEGSLTKGHFDLQTAAIEARTAILTVATVPLELVAQQSAAKNYGPGYSESEHRPQPVSIATLHRADHFGG